MFALRSMKELKLHCLRLWDIFESLNGYILVRAHSLRLKRIKEVVLSYAIGQNFALKYANLQDSNDIVVFLRGLSEEERAFFS